MWDIWSVICRTGDPRKVYILDTPLMEKHFGLSMDNTDICPFFIVLMFNFIKNVAIECWISNYIVIYTLVSCYRQTLLKSLTRLMVDQELLAISITVLCHVYPLPYCFIELCRWFGFNDLLNNSVSLSSDNFTSLIPYEDIPRILKSHRERYNLNILLLNKILLYNSR